MGRTLFEKIWDEHVVEDLGDGFSLLHVDRHLITDAGGKTLVELRRRGHTVRNPELCFASPDHVISTAPARAGMTPQGQRSLTNLRVETRAHGIQLFDVGDPAQGIVHVIAPELGLTLPGALVVCADSHTCTNGALGALAFGIGASEFLHVAATQTLVQQKPQTLRVWFHGSLGAGVTAKDLILHLVGTLGAAGGTGYAIEYAGEAIRSLDIEARLTLCNLSIELGAKVGMIAPDDKTFAYLHGREYAPTGSVWEAALQHWRTLYSDTDALFDREVQVDVSKVMPQITWGTSPEHVIGINECIPDPAAINDKNKQRSLQAALDYMELVAGQPIAGTPIDWVFIGSCTNARLSDIRAAAVVARGRHVASHVSAWVVPGSEAVKRAAEAEGLDAVFLAAGFQWREPGCSMCLAANGETVPSGQRAVSTSNRNFVGRQGPGSRTHLASPAMAAAAAISGVLTDCRQFEEQAV